MKKSWRNNVEFYLIGLLVLTVAAFSITMPEIFWSISNFQSVASQMPVLGILALAMAVTMLCGGINLSIIATANACSLVMAWVATQYPPGIATVVATLLAGAGAAVIIGLCNGVLIAGIRVSPILATLGMMTLLKGINILVTGGSAIANYPSWVLWLNHAQWFGIPLPMWLFAAVALGLWILLEKTPLGKSIYLIGSNERATLCPAWHYERCHAPPGRSFQSFHGERLMAPGLTYVLSATGSPFPTPAPAKGWSSSSNCR